MKSRVEKNEEIVKELDKEVQTERNKKILKIFSIIFIPLFVIFTISYISLRYIGNIGLIVKEYPVYSDRLPIDFNGTKIVQFSCIHYNQDTSKEKIKSLVENINKTNPDIVVFTGDLIDKNYNISMEEKEYLIEELSKIDALLGKYSIKGDEDSTIYEEIFKNSEFILLDNTIKNIYIDDSIIQLIAVNNNNYENLISSRDQNSFAIALTHFPDNTDAIVNNLDPNIVLAAHSHNGQVRFPFMGAIMKKEGARKYFDSYYEVNNTKLFITGGIGNSKYNFRLFNHPSINFIRLKSKTSSQ